MRYTVKGIKNCKKILSKRVREIAQFETKEALEVEFQRVFPQANPIPLSIAQMTKSLTLDALERTFPE